MVDNEVLCDIGHRSSDIVRPVRLSCGDEIQRCFLTFFSHIFNGIISDTGHARTLVLRSGCDTDLHAQLEDQKRNGTKS